MQYTFVMVESHETFKMPKKTLNPQLCRPSFYHWGGLKGGMMMMNNMKGKVRQAGKSSNNPPTTKNLGMRDPGSVSAS